jgi:hypothetical protein
MARCERSGGEQESFLLEALTIRTVRVEMLQDLFYRLAITNDGDRVHVWLLHALASAVA